MQKIHGLELNVDIVMKGDGKMEKIQLTQEQAEVVEVRRNRKDKSSAIEHHVRNGWFGQKYRFLNNFTVGELCRLLYVPNSYEVIPEFKVGDWITNGSSHVGRIQSIGPNGGLIGKWYVSPGAVAEMSTSPKSVRHATPEEKKKGFWWSIGREVDEYRRGDIVFNESTKLTYQVADGQLVPAKIVSCKLICPVEQRLDK